MERSVRPYSPSSTPPLRRVSCRAAVLLALSAASLSLGACSRVGVSVPSPRASLAACSVPDLDTRGWRTERDSIGGTTVTYRIPEGFDERVYENLSYRQFQVDSEPSGRVAVGFSPSREHYTTLRRAPSPPMHEMSECVADVNGRQVIFQAWRTEGGRFRNGQRYDLFETLALVPVEPRRTLYVSGGGSGPAFQEIALAIARTVDVEAP